MDFRDIWVGDTDYGGNFVTAEYLFYTHITHQMLAVIYDSDNIPATWPFKLILKKK